MSQTQRPLVWLLGKPCGLRACSSQGRSGVGAGGHCGISMKWKELAVNRMLLVMIKRRANTFFMIVQPKVLKGAEVFVTTVKRWSRGKKINHKITLSIWQLQWALSF